VVASSEEDVLASLVGFRNGLILIMALLIAGGSLFSYYTMRVWKIVQEDSIRTEVEQALRDSEERYRLHFQSASDVVYTVGRDLTILSVTPSVERLLGIKADQLMGRKVTDIKDFVASPSWEKVMNDTSKVLAGETVSSAEYELIRPDGSRLFVEVTANPIFRDGTVRAIAAIGRDVTERKMAEEAAEESRQQLADIIDFLPDATLVIDNDGIVIAWNRAMEEMTGIAAKDMLGKGTYEYALPFYGERRPILIDLVLREDDDIESKYVTVERGERVIQGEAYMPALRGGEVYLLGTASALRDRNGAFVGAIETIHDITERRHAEELYLTLATSAQVGVYIVQNGSFVFMNPHIVRYSGFSEDELIGKRSLAFVHPEDRAKVKEQAGESLRRQHASPYEYRIVDKSGSVRWLMETVSAIHYRGKPAVLGNTMDITERKHVERVLQESEEKYRLVVEHAGEAIFIAQDNVLKFANHQTTELIGYSEEELATIPFVNHIHPDDRSLVASMHEKRLRGEPAPAAYSFRSINRNGDPHWVSLNAVLVEWEGKPATLNFAQDITFQKNMEAQLLRSQKMEAVGTLAGGIAHDFNNLLMGIQGYASLMLLDTATTHPHREKLKSIEQLVQSGADLTRQLLGFSRGGRYETKPTNLNETIEKTSRMFGRTKKEISIFTKYEKELRSVEVDPGQIEQVLMNLYVNAWQAMPGGGTLFLETQNVVLDEYDAMGHDITPGEFVKIAVTDTGVGMDPQTMERIFDPFFTTKEMGRGTGLGLATVYGIVKGHKGIITVTSEKGKGTTFNIYLPVSAKAVPEQKEIQEEILRGKETILIIDDEEAIVATTKEMLENLGYRVMTARSGTEAIEIYKAGRDEIDLVVLDMIMPEMNGGETFDHLKRINPDIKTILSSGYSIDGQAQAILDRGCLAFLQKPFTMHILSQKVRQVLDLAT
jgi:PAS domain S-box-containing protein